MIVQKKDIKKDRVRQYLGVSYQIKKINNDGTFVANAYDNFNNNVQRLRTGNIVARFSQQSELPNLSVGETLYGVEAISIFDTKLKKHVYIVRSCNRKQISLSL